MERDIFLLVTLPAKKSPKASDPNRETHTGTLVMRPALWCLESAILLTMGP